jgi:signal transduction histidine kinase
LTEIGKDKPDQLFNVTAQPSDLMPLQQELNHERQLRHDLEAQLATAQQELRSLQAHIDERIETQVQQRTMQWELFHHLAEQIGSILDYEQLFQSLLEHLQLLVPCDVTVGVLVNPKTCELFFRSKQPLMSQTQADLIQTLLQHLSQQQQSNLQDHALRLHHVQGSSAPGAAGAIEMLRSQFVAPILDHSSPDAPVLGLLLIASADATPFNDDHQQAALHVAQQAAISVQQLRVLLQAESSTHRAEQDKALVKEKELSELKSRMIRTISHEYRTPLTVISLAAESLAHQYSRLNTKQRHNCFQQICRATQHMNKLINEVLWVSQAEAGEMEVRQQPTSMVQVCRQSMDELAVVNPEDGVRIHFQLTGEDVEVEVDPILLQQVLTHLLSNALKYSALDQSVQLTLDMTPRFAIVQVRDRGIGIPPADRPRLFECFHRAGNVGTVPGTGLGLAIARKCVELLGGTIIFESELGVGSCFTVTLPRSPSS